MEQELLEESLSKFPGRITYPGPIPNDQVGDFMARADVFLFPEPLQERGGATRRARGNGVGPSEL